MPVLTIRDVPGDVMERVRAWSARDRRSINKEALVLVEEGLAARTAATDASARPDGIPRELQLEVWRELAGRWKDRRSTAAIVADIRAGRTPGREVRL